jgi:hypothetical protein
LSECRLQLQAAESLVQKHQHEKEEALSERNSALIMRDECVKELVAAQQLAKESQASADNWKRECEDARRLCVSSDPERSYDASQIAVSNHDNSILTRELECAQDRIEELVQVNKTLLSDRRNELDNALGLTKSKYRGSLALGDGEYLSGDGEVEIEQLKRELKRVHRCLDGLSFAAKQTELNHKSEVDSLTKKMLEMEQACDLRKHKECLTVLFTTSSSLSIFTAPSYYICFFFLKDFGERRRALQEEVARLRKEEGERNATCSEVSNQEKTFKDVSMKHLEALLEDEVNFLLFLVVVIVVPWFICTRYRNGLILFWSIV